MPAASDLAITVRADFGLMQAQFDCVAGACEAMVGLQPLRNYAIELNALNALNEIQRAGDAARRCLGIGADRELEIAVRLDASQAPDSATTYSRSFRS